MDRPTFSQSWSRVSRLTPTLRPHVQIRRQLFRGEPWHVVHDPVSNNFFRLNPVAYYFVGLLDGKRQVDEAWRATLDRFGDEAPTQNEVIGVLGQLNQSNLLRIDMPPDAQPLLERHRRRKIQHWAGQAMSILFIKIPLINPDRMLKWLGPLFRPLLSLPVLIAWFFWIGYCIMQFLPHVRRFAYDADSVLAPANWAWMIALFAITKAIHELGHGLMCRRFGGLVPETGVMMLVLFPAPYVDATSSWSFPSKWKRFLVNAAGMMFELAIAGGAALVWIEADPGSLTQQLSYNVVFLASVTTILFNANPLLRFDGYYMLSDALEIANLYERAQKNLQWIIQRYAFGITSIPPVTTNPGEKRIMLVYGIASQIYRVFVLTGIILFVAGQMLTAGLILAAWSFFAWCLIPLGKFIRYLAVGPSVGEHRPRAIAVTVIFLTLVFIGIGVIPMDDHRRAEGVIESTNRVDIAMQTDGFVTEIPIHVGQKISAGQIILVSDNPKLRARQAELKAQIKQLQAQRRAGLVTDLVAMKMAQAKLDAAREELDRIGQRIDDLVLRAPQAGTIIGQFDTELLGRYIKRGKVLGRIVDLDNLRVTALVSQAHNASPFFGEIGRVELRFAGQIKRVVTSHVLRAFDSGTTQLPHPALGYAGGGKIAISQQSESGMDALHPHFEVHVDLPDDIAAIKPDDHDENTVTADPMPGQRVYVRFTLVKKRPMLAQWIERLHRLLRERIEA